MDHEGIKIVDDQSLEEEDDDHESIITHSMPFHELVPDCMRLILSYHYRTLWQEELPSRQLSRPTPQSVSGLELVLQHCKCEAHLSVILGEDFPLLENLHTLRLYRISNPERMDIFSCFKNLVELHLFYGPTIKDWIFSHFPSLEVLDIMGETDDQKYFTIGHVLSGLMTLKHLHLSHLITVTDYSIQKIYSGKHTPQLEKLEICRCKWITDDAFLLVNESLRELKICFCKRVTDKALEHLRGLERLVLSAISRVNSEAFKCLEGSAQYLDIFNSTVSFDDKAMSYLKGISTLILRRVHVENLTDEAFSFLKGSIKRLELKECEGISGLSKNLLWYLSGIEHVSLLDTEIRIEAEDLPRLKTIFKNVSYCAVSSNFADDSTLIELQRFIKGNECKYGEAIFVVERGEP